MLFFPFISLFAMLRFTVIYEDLPVFYKHFLLSFIVFLKTHICKSVLLSCNLERWDFNRLLVFGHISLHNNLLRLFRSCLVLVITKIEQIISDLVSLLLNFLCWLGLHNRKDFPAVFIFDLYTWRWFYDKLITFQIF